MFRHLQIPYRRERWLVGMADAGLGVLRVLGWPRRSDLAGPAIPRRILLLRLERVGDLIMVLDAIAMVRAMAPHAAIDLVVGSWNRALADLIPTVSSIESLDVPWLAREGSALPWPTLIGRTKGWRAKQYDLAINFEPDIRSNLLLALSGARRTVGFRSGGGGAVLTDAIAPDPRAHIAENAKTLVARAFETTGLKPCATDFEPTGSKPGTTNARGAETSAAQDISSVAQDFSPVSSVPVAQGISPVSSVPGAQGISSVAQGFSPVKLNIPDDARRIAARLVGTPTLATPIVGIQPATGRRVKEWDPARFAEVGAQIARDRGASIVLIGSTSDAAVLDAVRAAWPPDVPLTELPRDVDLVVLAAVLERLSLFITGDTGPMHLAAAVGTPVLAIFGPSLPTRYAPLSARSRMVRIDIHCSPCNLMRQPPARCLDRVPDCLAGIATVDVLRAANEMLNAS